MSALHDAGEGLKADVISSAVAAKGNKFIVFLNFSAFRSFFGMLFWDDKKEKERDRIKSCTHRVHDSDLFFGKNLLNIINQIYVIVIIHPGIIGNDPLCDHMPVFLVAVDHDDYLLGTTVA